MQKDIENFIDEITTKFSELFVETFFIKYLCEFERDELFKNFETARKLLNKKVKQKIEIKVKLNKQIND